MLSYDASSKLAALLLSIGSEEHQTEKIRQALCQYRDFEPYAAFQRIERSHTGSIVANDIRSFLAEHRIFYTENECYIFIKRFDKNGDSQLAYSEFLNALLPHNDPHLRAIATQRMNFKVSKNQNLSFETEKALAKLIDKEIATYLNLDLQKARLFQQDDFSYETAFSIIDKYSNCYIDFDNLRSFLLGQALYPEKDDIIAILRRLDRGEKGLISYEEFVAEVSPLNEMVTETFTQSYKKSVQVTIEKRPPIPHQRRNSSYLNSISKNETESPTLGWTSQYNLINRGPLLSSEKALKTDYKPEQTLSNTRTSTENNMNPFMTSYLAVSPQRIAKGNNEGKEQFLASQRRSSWSTAAKTFVKEANPLKEFTLSAEKDVQRALDFNDNKLNIAFIQTLRQLLKFTKELEVARENLALRPDFNIPAFFRTFRSEMRVFLSKNQFEQGLKQYCIYPDRKEVHLLFKRLDRDEDGALRVPDFEDMILSSQYEYASLVMDRGPFSREVQLEVDQLFSSETRRDINKVLRLSLENERLSESLKQRLVNTTTFSLKNAFEQFDLNQDGYVTAKEMKKVLESNDWYVTDQELALLMEMFDKNRDGRISFNEFCQELSAKI